LDPVFVDDKGAGVFGVVAVACQGDPVTAVVVLECDPGGRSLELELKVSRGRAISRD
jgi:hypothetical protein